MTILFAGAKWPVSWPREVSLRFGVFDGREDLLVEDKAAHEHILGNEEHWMLEAPHLFVESTPSIYWGFFGRGWPRASIEETRGSKTRSLGDCPSPVALEYQIDAAVHFLAAVGLISTHLTPPSLPRSPITP